MTKIYRTNQLISYRNKIRTANVFHAGDGNIHPILIFDERDPQQVERVLQASAEILDECLACGGSVTGEHGIGVEKINFMPKLFSPEDLEVMMRVRRAFNPTGLCSRGKMLPTAGACVEPTKAGRRAAL
jgi:glycolate oxidase